MKLFLAAAAVAAMGLWALTSLIGPEPRLARSGEYQVAQSACPNGQCP